MATEKPTEEDVNMIRYFIKEKGDITRWVHWEERKPVIKKAFPDLMRAIRKLERAERRLDIELDALYELDLEQENNHG